MRRSTRSKISVGVVFLLTMQFLFTPMAYAANTVVQFDPLDSDAATITCNADSQEALDVESTFPTELAADIDGAGPGLVDVLEWVSDIPYDPTAEGTYVFSPLFDDAVWDLSSIDPAQMPTITVVLNSAVSADPPEEVAPLAAVAVLVIDLTTATLPIILGPGHIEDDVRITGSITGNSTAIRVLEGYNKTIILAGVTIDVSGDGAIANDYFAAMTIEGSGNVATVTNYVNVVLEDLTSNTLISGRRRAGLEVNAGAQVNISGPLGTLNAACAKDQTDSSTYGAGIGAGYQSAFGVYLYGGNIVIESGTIIATAGYHGAGIGGSGYGGSPKYSGHVVIYGGNITSNGGAHGSGIGGGCGNNLGGGATGTTGMLLVLPPAQITASSAGSYANVGAMSISVYIGDPAAPLVQVSTEDNAKNVDIFMDLSNVSGVELALLQTLVPTSIVDPSRILLGNTGSSGVAEIHMRTLTPVTFYTDALFRNSELYIPEQAIIGGNTFIILKTGITEPDIPGTSDNLVPIYLIAIFALGAAGLIYASTKVRRKRT